MTEPELRQLIELHPDRGTLPVACVLAVCQAESSLNEWAYRFEPHFKWLVGHADDLSATERTGQMISWGLMQVMGAVAREYGFTGTLPSLCLPSLGLKFGMKHLTKFYAKYQDWPDTLASYNAGSPKKNADGKFYNQAYVDLVLRLWAQYEHVIPLKASEV